MMRTFRSFCYRVIFMSRLVYIIRWVYRKTRRNPIRVLYAHKVIDGLDDHFPFLRGLGYLTVEEFEQRIKYLLKHYRIISIDECLKYLSVDRRPPNCVVLTFDDGYRSVYTRVFPVLKKYNVPATTFVTVDGIDTNRMLWHDKLLYLLAQMPVKEFKVPGLSGKTYDISTPTLRKEAYKDINSRLKAVDNSLKEAVLHKMLQDQKIDIHHIETTRLMLSWDEIREMQNSGLICSGSHTLTHPIFTRIPLQRCEYEIEYSKRRMEEELGARVKYFSYPGGILNESVKHLVQKSGYLAAFGTSEGGNNHKSDLFVLSRDGFAQEPLWMFGLRMAGFFDLVGARAGRRQIVKPDEKGRIGAKGFRYWVPQYFWQSIVPREEPDGTKPTHIMLCIVDHFEPCHGGVSFREAEARVKGWVEEYSRRIDRFRDADGKKPQHTWFYPPHHNHRFLQDLLQLCKSGYGEIEMHLHHDLMPPFPDTPETLRSKIMKCIRDYSQHGIFSLPDGRKTFAFIHGDWSLDNSLGAKFCGVNDEIEILKDCGCYADFTFPSLGRTQPAMINKIYYAKDDPGRPKSYNWGKEVVAGRRGDGDLLMIPGIIGLRWKSRGRGLRPSVETSNIDTSDYPVPARIDYWIKHGIRIKGRPNWLFIKLHTHGASEADAGPLFGRVSERLYDYLDSKYNRRNMYFLHFVTAREMYNIIKAAEAGQDGDPGLYRDYRIPPYLYIGNEHSSLASKPRQH